MSASTQDRNTERRSGEELSLPVAASTIIYAGILVALNSGGYLVAAADTAALKVVGRSEERVDNSAGANGLLNCQVRRGVFLFDNSATAALDKDDVGKQCFVEDDHTVAETSTNSIKAGRFLGFGGDPSGSDETLCWVETPGAFGSLGSFTQTQDTLTDSSTGAVSTTLAAMTGVDGVGSNAAPLTATKNAVASLAAQLAKVKTDIAALKSALT